MTPPVSQCRRALLQHHLVQPKDALWITDGLLASAFDRYCRVSRTWNRKASNVPGPLESQRRLGRRRVGDASTWHCPPTPPAWAFLVPLDLTKWTWTPPSPPSTFRASREPHDATTQGPLLPLLPRWLRQPDSPTAPAQPETRIPPRSAPPSAPFTDATDRFRWAAAHGDDAALISHARDLLPTLRQGIALGEILPNELAELIQEIFKTLESRLRGSPADRELSLSLCRTVLSGLADSRVLSATLMEAPFWGAILSHMARLPGDDELCDLFVGVMEAMPVAHRSQVADSIVAVLGRFFSEWRCAQVVIKAQETGNLLDIVLHGGLDEPEALPSCLRQARAISAALTCGTPDETKALLQAAQDLARSEAAACATGRHVLRFSWLQVLAQQPHVNQDVLFEAAASLSDPSLNPQPLSAVEISSLLLTQWASRNYLKSPQQVYHSYRQHLAGRDEAALASLFLAIFAHGHGTARNGLYRSAWKLLARLGRTDAALESLQFDAATATLPVRMLEELAVTSDDHRMAIRLRDLWASIKADGQPQWFPGVFDKYAEAIVCDPEIPASEIWRVLDIGKIEEIPKVERLWKSLKDAGPASPAPPSSRAAMRSLVLRRQNQGAFGERRAAVVEKAARAFMEAPHLSDRAALRHMSRAFAFLHAVRGQVPDFLLRNLYHLVARDLKEGRPGRTKRLLWFLMIVERRHGLEVAWKCRLLLREWRRRLIMIAKAHGIDIPRR
ncbi:hypothetical protein VTJ83DRAFT_576 [Remersonia thermophila]|uniref:Uncharacterized protein n=1 Tax=Remersonia thermophila TaxID=72144 RepID=A0ABR4DLC1_9PEZI